MRGQDNQLEKPCLIDKRNRVTLPRDVIRLLDIKRNDYLCFFKDNNRVIVGKAKISYEYIEDVDKI